MIFPPISGEDMRSESNISLSAKAFILIYFQGSIAMGQQVDFPSE